jgi:two-component system cell cycle sensor histidine kinase/response regulator CckA
MDHDAPSGEGRDEAARASLRSQVAALESRLAQTERLVEALLDHVPLGVQVFDAAGASLRVNERQRALLGLTEADEPDAAGPALMDAPSFTEAFRRAVAGEVVRLPARRCDLGSDESRSLGDQGSVWARQTLAPVRGPGGTVEAVIAFVEDIPAARAAQDSRERTGEIWADFFERTPLAIQIFDRHGTSLRMNEAYRRLLGTPDVTYGVGLFNALTDPFMISLGRAALFERAYAGELVELPEISTDFDNPANRWQTGRHRAYYTQFLVPIRDADGSVAAVISCAIDITGRKRAEQAVQQLNASLEAQMVERTTTLRETVDRLEREVAERRQIEATLRASEERYRALVEASPDLLFRIAHDRSFLDVHAPQADQLFLPAEQFLGRRIEQVMPAELTDIFAGAIDRALSSGEVQGAEYVLAMPEGERWFEARIVRSGHGEVFASVRDTTARRQAEEARLQVERRLQETQRLESLAVLAGGIAHDFNNILTTVLGHAELALAEPISPAIRDHLSAIGAGARRAADLTAQILAYSGRGRVQSQPVALSALVREMQSLVATIAGPYADVRYQPAEGRALVIGDAEQLRQLVLNLVTNAAEALDSAAGTITVETTAEELSRARLDQLVLGAYASPGPFVRLTVRDTGAGMDPATLARIFDPFFSTRFTGRGLGLAAVHGIVRGHHGAMEVQSAPGRGTLFQVWLPALRAAEPPALLRGSARLQPDGGRLLVVDDEEGVRLVLRRLLEREGYAVEVAHDAAAATALLEAGIPGLAGVLLDLTMPGVPSEEVAVALRTTHPEAPLLLMSGYSQEELAERQRALGAVGWLQKPFSADMLRATVGQAFGKPAR